ncbi:hypothetical protein XENOCAPTIV_007051, partial [Xenoophorus captivus]
KSWLVPTQYLLGLFMLYLSATVNSLLQSEKGPNVVMLTAVFFMLAFLAATQDIAVDGWALTMLSRENVGYASTCNSVGQTAGYFLGNVLFLALESPEFCNKYLRLVPKDTGIVTLPADAVTGLKLVEAGVPKEQLALLAVPMVPLQILLPVVISRYTAGPRPLDVFYKAFPFR